MATGNFFKKGNCFALLLWIILWTDSKFKSLNVFIFTVPVVLYFTFFFFFGAFIMLIPQIRGEWSSRRTLTLQTTSRRNGCSLDLRKCGL